MSKRRTVSEEWNLGYEAGVGAGVRRALSERKIEVDKLTAENGMLQNRLRQAQERLAATEKELAKTAKAAAKASRARATGAEPFQAPALQDLGRLKQGDGMMPAGSSTAAPQAILAPERRQMTKRFVSPDHPGGIPAYIEDPNRKDAFLSLDTAPNDAVIATIAEMRTQATELSKQADRLEDYLKRRRPDKARDR